MTIREAKYTTERMEQAHRGAAAERTELRARCAQNGIRENSYYY